jgi:L-malate glycosyltransferase
LGLPADAFVIGSVGRLAVEKNQRALIAALAALRDRAIETHLVIVGEGAQRAALARQVAELRLQSHVTLAGSQRDVRPWLAAMDVFVLPSTHIETFSNAALEAMAMAKPTILSEVGGATEMVRDGIDGYTLACDKLDATLPSVLIRLHDDAALRATLGRAARERAQAKFSAVSMIDEFAELIAGPRHIQAVS